MNIHNKSTLSKLFAILIVLSMILTIVPIGMVMADDDNGDGYGMSGIDLSANPDAFVRTNSTRITISFENELYVYEDGEKEYLIRGGGVYEDDDEGDREYNIKDINLTIELANNIEVVIGSFTRTPSINGRILTWNNLGNNISLINDISFNVTPIVSGRNIPINTRNSNITFTLTEHDDDDKDDVVYNVRISNMNINPTNSRHNNELEINDTTGRIYVLQKRGNDKGLIDERGNIINVLSNPHSGNATRIIFRSKRNNIVRIDGTPFNLENNRRYTIIANDPNNPIAYTVWQKQRGAGHFYINLTATNATILLDGNRLVVDEEWDDDKSTFIFPLPIVTVCVVEPGIKIPLLAVSTRINPEAIMINNTTTMTVDITGRSSIIGQQLKRPVDAMLVMHLPELIEDDDGEYVRPFAKKVHDHFTSNLNSNTDRVGIISFVEREENPKYRIFRLNLRKSDITAAEIRNAIRGDGMNPVHTFTDDHDDRAKAYQINAAIDHFNANPRTNVTRAIILFTEEDDADDEYGLLKAASQRAKNAGIPIYIIYVDDDVFEEPELNDELDKRLKNIATMTGGRYFHALTQQTLNSILDGLTTTLTIVSATTAENVRLEIVLEDRVFCVIDPSRRTLSWNLGTISAGETVSIPFEVRVNRSGQNVSINTINSVVTYVGGSVPVQIGIVDVYQPLEVISSNLINIPPDGTPIGNISMIEGIANIRNLNWNSATVNVTLYVDGIEFVSTDTNITAGSNTLINISTPFIASRSGIHVVEMRMDSHAIEHTITLNNNHILDNGTFTVVIPAVN